MDHVGIVSPYSLLTTRKIEIGLGFRIQDLEFRSKSELPR